MGSNLTATKGLVSLLSIPVGIMVAAFALSLTGCGPSPQEAWQRAQRQWEARAPQAYGTWMTLPEGSEEAASARRRIRRADRLYRQGINRFRQGDTQGARRAFEKASRLGPIAPDHYMTLAELYEERGLKERAYRYYRKLTAADPKSARATEARRRALRLAAQTDTLLEPEIPSHRYLDEERSASKWARLLSGVGIGLALAFIAVLFRPGKRPRARSLARVIESNPQLHTAASFVVGSVRHELLKHRLAVVQEVLSAWRSGHATEEQRIYLHERLYGGTSILDAFKAHADAFERALGHRFSWEKERTFRDAKRALRNIVRLRPHIEQGRPEGIEALGKAHEAMKSFDRYLASLQKSLTRTRIDGALFENAVDQVRGESRAGRVEIPHLDWDDEIAEPIYVEVPRDDLLLILKNLVRNAVLAVEPLAVEKRSVVIGVTTVLEPTGEEIARIGVSDSSPCLPDLGGASSNRAFSGLALCVAAAKRYGGAMGVTPTKGRLSAKTVFVQFFRV